MKMATGVNVSGIKKEQELLGKFSSTVEQNCIIKKDDLRAKNL
jgi:hypothetical protein